eukprot:TRINITY_DN3965_c0_g2_i2.p3 TRINITY_DN3965_c0_g2~~TRINITY_DN3965_c0_g2_i2.p3  ORF type:complete len:118 (-),score=35.33 TRINITY_DN3965_c0_g2_i2:240-593(-)
MQHVTEVYRYAIKEMVDTRQYFDADFMTRRIERVFKFAEPFLAKHEYFWGRWAEYHEYRGIYLRERAKIAIPKEAPEKQAEALEKLNAELKEAQTQVAEYCLKECQTIMVVGWEIEK